MFPVSALPLAWLAAQVPAFGLPRSSCWASGAPAYDWICPSGSVPKRNGEPSSAKEEDDAPVPNRSSGEPVAASQAGARSIRPAMTGGSRVEAGGAGLPPEPISLFPPGSSLGKQGGAALGIVGRAARREPAGVAVPGISASAGRSNSHRAADGEWRRRESGGTSGDEEGATSDITDRKATRAARWDQGLRSQTEGFFQRPCGAPSSCSSGSVASEAEEGHCQGGGEETGTGETACTRRCRGASADARSQDEQNSGENDHAGASPSMYTKHEAPRRRSQPVPRLFPKRG